MTRQAEKIKIVSLGGLNEIGKNMYVYEFAKQMIIIDCGMAFPDEDLLGIDSVIPDTTYLEKNKEKILGIVLTHGHEDHIGALPYVLRNINVPVYGTKLTLGIVHNKLKEHRMDKSTKLIEVSAGDTINLGPFGVEFIRVNHSIADAVAIALHTKIGVVVHTGDFKVDVSPIQGEMIDLTRLGELGKKGVLALLSDSTNVERPGFAMSERHVGASFEKLFKSNLDHRIIVATFASNVHRVQQIIDAAVNAGRKVAVSGRSMVNILNVAMQLGYMNIPDGTLVDIDTISRYPYGKMVIITTGSQGEPMSALYRMAYSDHKKVEIGPQDLVIISAKPIPGNEKLVSRVINELFKSGAEVVYDSLADVHVSGHACQEEVKLMMALTKPKYVIPVHGEYRHLKKNAQVAKFMGIDPKNIFILSIGQVLEISRTGAKISGNVQSGRVLVDGLGVGDVGNIVLRDRKHLAQDGLIVVVATFDSATGTLTSGPDIISRGFVYVREAEDLMEAARKVARNALLDCEKHQIKEWGTIKSKVRDSLNSYIYDKTKRSPMILPVIMEV